GIGAWLARLMVDEGLWTDADVAPLGQDGDAAWERVLDRVRAFADAAASRPGLTIVVAEEGGLGLVPQGAGARRYLDLMGEGTQLLAKAADAVQLVVAGQAIALPQATRPPRGAPGGRRGGPRHTGPPPHRGGPGGPPGPASGRPGGRRPDRPARARHPRQAPP